jgi:hypothetical protein
MRASLEWHMDIKVLRPLTRMFCSLPRQVAAQEDSGAAKGARAGGEAGVVVEVPTAAMAGGGGGTAGPQTT